MISIPFSGSKRYSYKNVKAIVEQGDYDVVYEPFGGSCVLSVNLLNDGLVKRAIINDYDHFFDNYETYLDLKDKVVEEGYKAGFKGTSHDGKRGNYYFNKDGSITPIKSEILQGEDRKKLQEIISENVPKEYWRYFATGSNFTYSAVSTHPIIRLSDFCKFSRRLETQTQRKYLSLLNQCEIENLDWKDFFKKNHPDKNSIVILDPPYVDTAQEQYKGQFTEEDTIELINTVKAFGCDFIFFNHDMDKVKEWLGDLDYTTDYTGNISTSANRKRKDVMAYVKNTDTH